jgi:hypothetical protein
MKICVCGWYFTDDWYGSLLKLHNKFPVKVIANRDDEFLKLCRLPYSIRENKGLEFGAYSEYLTNFWDGDSVIFCHDDLQFIPIGQGHRIISGEDLFPKLSELECDQAYVFNNRNDDVDNAGIHGRMIYMSDKLLSWLKNNGGIWFDGKNEGITYALNGTVAEYNQGIYHFNYKMQEAEKAGFDINNKVYFPGIAFGCRGRFKGKIIQ